MMKTPCKLCRYWHADALPRADMPDSYLSDDGRGECRRRAPIHQDALTHVAHWPITYQYEWCGEGASK